MQRLPTGRFSTSKSARFASATAPSKKTLKTKDPPTDAGGVPVEDLLLIATLVASLAKKLAVLLLRHTLAALLNN